MNRRRFLAASGTAVGASVLLPPPDGSGKDIGIENFAHSGDAGETIELRGSTEATGAMAS